MWPFKKRQELTLAELVKDKPDVPCGGKEQHYQWTLFYGMGCPKCQRIKERENKAREQAQLAKLIAAELAPLLAQALGAQRLRGEQHATLEDTLPN